MKKVFQTPRLYGRHATEDDYTQVLDIYDSNRELLLLLDRNYKPAYFAERFAQRRNLPSGGDPHWLRNLVLLSAETDQLIGLLSLYAGYPRPEVGYIGEYFLLKNSQNQGFGQEGYRALESGLRQTRLRSVRVGVGLRNWNALRFWIRQGFSHITGMSGDRLFAPDTFAHLELSKSL